MATASRRSSGARTCSAFVELDSGLDGRPDIDYDWRSVADYLARYDGTVSVNVGTLVGNSQLRIAALGLGRRPGRRPGARPDARHCSRDAMAEGAVGLSIGPRLPARRATPRPRSSPRSPPRPAAPAASTTPTSAISSATATSIRSGRPSRSAGAPARPAHITHFYHRQTHPGGPEALLALVDDARAEGLDVTFDSYPSEWASTRLLIQLPQWIQEGGPGPLKAAPRRPRGPRPAARGVHGARRRIRRPGGLGGRAPRCLPPARTSSAGSRDGGRRHAGDGPRRGRRHLRPAARRGPRRQPGHERPVVRDAPPVRGPPGRDGRHGLHVHRRQAESADLRLATRASSASSSATRGC